LPHLLKATQFDLFFWSVTTKEEVADWGDYDLVRDLLLQTRQKGITEILVLTGPRLVHRVLKSARRLGLISTQYSWLVLNLVISLHSDPQQVLFDIDQIFITYTDN